VLDEICRPKYRCCISYSGSKRILRSDPSLRDLSSHLTRMSTRSPGYNIPTRSTDKPSIPHFPSTWNGVNSALEMPIENPATDLIFCQPASWTLTMNIPCVDKSQSGLNEPGTKYYGHIFGFDLPAFNWTYRHCH